MDRRTFLVGAASAAVLPWRTLWASTGKFEEVSVTTPLGALRGSAEGGVRRFLGVPFAKPPVGPLRFRPSELPEPWTGVRDATRFAPAAVQTGRSANDISEDCLYLNVWAPSSPGPHPVYVWIHGGGNTGGGTNDSGADGTTFARDGIVCVTVAYRLGALGFLELGNLLGPEYRGSGDNGLGDLVTALRWVKQNIAAFGGDPAQVTIGGESAGAKNVAALVGSPTAKGLFARAIMESGSGQTVQTVASADEVAHQYLDALGLSRSEAARLKALSPAELLAGQQKLGDHYPHAFPFRAVVGVPFLPKRPVDMVTSGTSRDVSLLIGTNRDESLLFFDPKNGSKPIEGREVANAPIEIVTQAEAKYRRAYPDLSDLDRRIRTLTAEEYWIPSVRMAEAHAKAGGATRMYRFDRTQPNPTQSHYGYAVHASELSFVWNHLPASASSDARELARLMHAAWVAFIKTGDPQVTGMPRWPQYDAKHRSTLLFGQNVGAVTVANDPRGDERKLWNGVL